VIERGIDISKFKFSLPFNGNVPVVAYLGRISPIKGVE
jgi:glycosyltransferase involved in cell wall biosynthesis